MKLNIRHSSPLPLLERKHAWFIVDVLLRGKSWLIPLGRVPLLSHWSKTLSWYEHKLLHAPSPSMSVHACESVRVLVPVCPPPVCVCPCVCVSMREAVGVLYYVCVCAYASPITRGCIMHCCWHGLHAQPSMLQCGTMHTSSHPCCTPLSCPQAASFTFAPELMLVNCHINSDLLARFVNNTNRARLCAIAGVIFSNFFSFFFFSLIRSTRMDRVGLWQLPESRSHPCNLNKMWLRKIFKALLCLHAFFVLFFSSPPHCVREWLQQCRCFIQGAQNPWAWTLDWICVCLHMYMCAERVCACQELSV